MSSIRVKLYTETASDSDEAAPEYYVSDEKEDLTRNVDCSVSDEDYKLLVDFVYAKAHFNGEITKDPTISFDGLLDIIRASNALDEQRSANERDAMDTIKRVFEL